MTQVNSLDEELNNLIEDTYYKISAMFGKIDYAGCFHLAVAVALYKADCVRLIEVLRQVAELTDSTPGAVERNIRTYLKVILENKTIEEISDMIGFPLSNYDGTLKAKEFIAALKLYFTVNSEVE